MASMDLNELKDRQDLRSNVKTMKAYHARVRELTADLRKIRTAEVFASREKRRVARAASKRAERGIFSESGMMGDMKDSGVSEENENVTDFSGEVPQRVTLGQMPSSTDVGQREVHSIAKFFERPVTIYDSTWSTDTEYNVNILPWDLWSKNAAVRSKLSNYAYFKGTLHVKISFTGTPFHYGMVMASYQPWYASNLMLGAYDDLLVSTVPLVGDILPLYKGYMSQAPGVRYIDVKSNEPLCLEIPFTSPKQVANLYNESNDLITNSDSFDDLAQMGALRMITLNKLQVANEDYANAVSVNVYAWVTDVTLGTITGTNIDITAEARRRKSKIKKKAEAIETMAEEIESDVDEGGEEEEPDNRPNWQKGMDGKAAYASGVSWRERISNTVQQAGTEFETPGPVSQVATAVTNAGEALKDVPIIGNFAKSTASVARGIGKVASWFGFSKPNVLEKTGLFKAEPFYNGALLAGNDTTKKLACDPKQELSVDNSLGGAGDQDCMAIKHLTSRESYVTTFDWSRTNAAMTTTLWETLISPNVVFACDSASLRTIYQPTAMAFATMPFAYWRGSITWRFEVVCSKFHRGKLLFKFDPNFSQAVLISSDSTKLNQQNTVILDIQEKQEIEITVKFVKSRSWCKVRDSNLWTYPICDTENYSLDYSKHTHLTNIGFLQVRPLNELVQPTDLSTVHVNCYVKSNDLELAVPSADAIALQRQYTETESGKASDITFNEQAGDNSNVYLQHFGEKVLSFRSLMKRYHTTGVYSYSQDSGSSTRVHSLKHNLYPTTKKAPVQNTSYYDPSATDHLFDYLRYAYMGVRGGFRYRVMLVADGNYRQQDTSIVRLIPSSSVDYYQPAIVDTRTQNATNTIDACQSTLDGGVRHVPNVSGGVEFEVPYYSQNLFDFAWEGTRGSDAYAEDIFSYANVTWEYGCPHNTSTGDKINLVVDGASAEDFTFLRFQGAPFYTADTPS